MRESRVRGILKGIIRLARFRQGHILGQACPDIVFVRHLAIPNPCGIIAMQRRSSKPMAEKPSSPLGDKPRAEPEIIPPGAPLRPSRTYGFADQHFAQRIYIAKIGPFGIILLALAIG